MTTPASNLNKTIQETYSGTLYRTWTGTTIPVSNTNNVGFHRLIRPASGTSPVREDGTRAPRAFGVRWGEGLMATSHKVFRAQSGSSPSVYMQYDVDGMGDSQLNADYFLTQCDASWARLASPGVFPPNVESSARTNFLKELADGRMQLGASLAELRQTSRLVTSVNGDLLNGLQEIAKGVGTSVSAVNQVLRGKFRPMSLGGLRDAMRRGSSQLGDRSREAARRAWDHKNVINKRWLELQFGIRPLLSDIQDAGQALSWMINEEKLRATVVIRKGSSHRAWPTAVLGSALAPGWSLHVPCLVETSAHISACYEIPWTDERTLQQLGLGNPASVLWEITQYSWMVDYLLGVGDWLTSLTADRGVSFVEGSISRKQEAQVIGPGQFHPAPGWTLVKGFIPKVYRVKCGRFDREVLHTAVFPAVFPPIRSRLGLTQLANSLAALAQLRK